MSLQPARQLVLGFHPDLPVVVAESAAQLSSDGGLLVIREFDERLKFTARFAEALEDTRDPACTRHGVLSLVRQRLYGLIADDEDQNDHDELRHDPVFQLVEIVIRADSGFGVPLMYDVCEELGVTYTFGFAMNPRLQRQTQALLDQAVQQYEVTRQKQRLFELLDYQADSWPCPRTVIVKCEAHSVGTNRRAIVTNRPGAPILPQGTYDEYVMRGESENRNKELKDGLHADRLSDHRFLANFFRLFLHAAALNLLVRLRRATTKSPTPAELGIFDPVPAAALSETSNAVGDIEETILQSPSASRPAGRRPALHLAQPADQGRRGSDRQLPPRAGETLVELAARRRPVPAG